MPAPRTESRVEATVPASLQTLVNTTAGTAQTFTQASCLSANARGRIIALKNSGAQSAAVTVSPYLSTIGNTGNNVTSSSVTIAANSVAYITSAQLASVDEPWDSLAVSINYTTLPGAGTGVSVTINERI